MKDIENFAPLVGTSLAVIKCVAYSANDDDRLQWRGSRSLADLVGCSESAAKIAFAQAEALDMCSRPPPEEWTDRVRKSRRTRKGGRQSVVRFVEPVDSRWLRGLFLNPLNQPPEADGLPRAEWRLLQRANGGKARAEGLIERWARGVGSGPRLTSTITKAASMLSIARGLAVRDRFRRFAWAGEP